MQEINNWIDFIQHSPTAYHAADQVAKRLLEKRFIHLTDNNWSEVFNKATHHDNGYFISKEGSIIAFYLSKSNLKNQSPSFRLWGAHTDSPGLKLKPISEINKKGYQMISTEVYGGAILSPWLDRPLGLAGRVFIQKKQDSQTKSGDALTKRVEERLLFINEPLMVIPHAAIHLNREVNKQFVLNRETHLPALFSNQETSLASYLANYLDCDPKSILAHDLFLVDIEPPKIFGREKEFINSPSLDNLAMVDAGLQGFINRLDKKNDDLQAIPLIMFFNHEEIGSQTYSGAMSNFLSETLKRLVKHLFPQEELYSCMSRSFMISADMAHGFHPNFESLYESNHRPILNKGVVIKHNANHRYTTNAATAAICKEILNSQNIPYQEYVQHGEIPCGSTIGPIVSSQLGIPTVDLGSPLLAMHSIRETAGIHDHALAIKLAEKFLTY